MGKKIKVAVLGGTGFVGRNVVEYLADCGHDAQPFSRSTGCDLEDLPEASSQIFRYQPLPILL